LSSSDLFKIGLCVQTALLFLMLINVIVNYLIILLLISCYIHAI